MSDFPYTPINDRIVVKPIEVSNMTAGGIELPQSALERPNKGTVVAVGPGKLTDGGQRVPCACKRGQIVIYNRYSGSQVEIDGQEYYVMREDEAMLHLERK